MFEFVESVNVDAPSPDVWEYVADVEQWWLASHPEHLSLKVRSPGPAIGLGTEIVFEELVAGLKGQAKGMVTEWIPGVRVSWEGTAKYSFFGISLRINEGFSWQVQKVGKGTILSAHVRADFSSPLTGRLFKWQSRRIRRVAERDREHARRELLYLKSVIESEYLQPVKT